MCDSANALAENREYSAGYYFEFLKYIGFLLGVLLVIEIASIIFHFKGYGPPTLYMGKYNITLMRIEHYASVGHSINMTQ